MKVQGDAQSGAPQRRDRKREARKALNAAGIDVRDSNPAFDLTHQKSMVIDDKIGSWNR